jgi:predicted unusual protein kinase regulating ubiquinone biosynthesis (AarF/ABC1/UbiB family)
METIDKIPTTKIQRASKILQTGAKVGVNYLKFYGDKLLSSESEALSNLHQSNASDIYDGLKQLKGSALKVAQMLSMENNILPEAYGDKFSLSQFSVPPLSAPLVNKTFKTYFGKTPKEIFTEFNSNATNAASIGQVHQAKTNDKKLAVKIQYPGVADSISSDLALVKPIALKMFNIKGKDSDKYFKEVENKLIEETNYTLEIEESINLSNQCRNIKNLIFPTYYKEFSCERIITMDWMEGKHLSEYVKEETNQQKRNEIGQTLWDFYMFQLHGLFKVHADPHPGNFLVSEKNELIAIDFGCMKAIPMEFYTPYFDLTNPTILNNSEEFDIRLKKLEIIREDDNEIEASFFTKMFHELLTHFTLPFQSDQFNFSDADYFNAIADIGKKYAQNVELKKYNGNRGSKHFIYINRTLFGLYNLMHSLKADEIKINNFKSLLN